MIINFKIYENATDIVINTNLNQKYIDYLIDNLSINVYKRINSVKTYKIKSINGDSNDKKTNIFINMSNKDTISGTYQSKDNSIIVKINDELIYDVDYKDFNIKKLLNRIVTEFKKHLKKNKWKIK